MSLHMGQVESVTAFIHGLQELEAEHGLHLYSHDTVYLDDQANISLVKIEWTDDDQYEVETAC